MLFKTNFSFTVVVCEKTWSPFVAVISHDAGVHGVVDDRKAGPVCIWTTLSITGNRFHVAKSTDYVTFQSYILSTLLIEYHFNCNGMDEIFNTYAFFQKGN